MKEITQRKAITQRNYSKKQNDKGIGSRQGPTGHGANSEIIVTVP